MIVYERDEATGGYQEVGCGIEVEPSGRVYVVAAEGVSLSGKVVIR